VHFLQTVTRPPGVFQLTLPVPHIRSFDRFDHFDHF
jgi:hypothetical protein